MWLRKGDHSVLVSPVGGSILQWQYREKTILGPTGISRIDGDLKKRGETHWCFPNFGSVPEKSTLKFQKHGFLRDTLLNTNRLLNDSVRFEKEEALSEINTSLIIDVLVDEHGVRSSLCALNKGEYKVPLLPALHPYFKTPKDGLSIIIGGSVVAQVLPEASSGDVSLMPRILERNGRRVYIKLHGIGQVNMQLRNHCTHIVIWSDNPTQYVCVEPIYGEPGSFGIDEGVWLLPYEQTFCDVNFVFKPVEAQKS